MRKGGYDEQVLFDRNLPDGSLIDLVELLSRHIAAGDCETGSPCSHPDCVGADTGANFSRCCHGAYGFAETGKG